MNIIWQDTTFVCESSLKSWKEEAREFLLESNDFVTDVEVTELVEDENYSCLEDARTDFRNISLPEQILCTGNLGLWHGRVPGYAEIAALDDCLVPRVNSSFCRWFVDDFGNFRAEESHHDGTNFYLYRMWKPGISKAKKEALLNKIYNGQAERADVLKCTVRLGDFIGHLYGWTFKGRKPAAFLSYAKGGV